MFQAVKITMTVNRMGVAKIGIAEYPMGVAWKMWQSMVWLWQERHGREITCMEALSLEPFA